jgi:hypothetical protein
MEEHYHVPPFTAAGSSHSFPFSIFRLTFTQPSTTGILDAALTLNCKPAKKIPPSPSQGSSDIILKLASVFWRLYPPPSSVVDAVNHMATHTDVQKACSSSTKSCPSITFWENGG